jgi:hypothetical protein
MPMSTLETSLGVSLLTQSQRKVIMLLDHVKTFLPHASVSGIIPTFFVLKLAFLVIVSKLENSDVRRVLWSCLAGALRLLGFQVQPVLKGLSHLTLSIMSFGSWSDPGAIFLPFDYLL